MSNLPETDLIEPDPQLEEDEEVPQDSPSKVFGFLVPPGTLRVRVQDAKGNIRWRKLHEVLPEDAPDLGSDGRPIFMNRPVGRPSKVDLHESMPPVTKLVGDLLKIKAAQMRSDPIVQVAESTPESPDVLSQVMLGMAEEAASLRFERMEAERNGSDSSQFSMRRTQTLKAIGDTWIKRKEQIQNRAIDIESPAFEALFRFISETFANALQESGARPELVDSIFSAFAKKVADDAWKAEAKSRMKE
jgi:hypothetical protein